MTETLIEGKIFKLKYYNYSELQHRTVGILLYVCMYYDEAFAAQRLGEKKLSDKRETLCSKQLYSLYNANKIVKLK